MKKNYNSLPRGAGNFLPSPGSNSKAFACWLSNHFKGKNLLVAAFLFMLSTVQFFAQTGETCETAIDLGTQTSPLTSTTAGTANDYTPSCQTFSSAGDLVYSISVPNGYTLNIGQSSNIGVSSSGTPLNYDSIHSVYYGTCESQTLLICIDAPETPVEGNNSQVEWENTTGSTQTVYWYQDGYGSGEVPGMMINEGEFTLTWLLTPPPTCNIPRAVSAALTSAITADLTWAAPITGTPTNYEYALTNSATPPASGTVTTATAVYGVAITTNQNTYLHVRTNCGTTDGHSEWVTYAFYYNICIPASPYVSATGITNVAIGSINNTTGLEATNYGDFSSQIVNVGQGITQEFSITFNPYDAYNVKIWVDWNNNLTFDENEEVYSGTSEARGNAVLTGTFTVPSTAALGNHRLRIAGMINWNGEPIPCSTDQYYVVFEDYTVNVTVPPTCFTPASPLGTATASGLANLSWTAPTVGGSPVGYEYVVDTNMASPASGTAVTGTSVTGYAGIVDNTYYYLHVRTNCGAGDYSEWVTSTRFRFLQGDTCATAISLDALTSPLSSTTVGAGNDYAPSCGYSIAPDIYYSITVPNGYVLVAGLTASSYDYEHILFYGDCTTQTEIFCTDSETGDTTWENTTGTTQTVYWVKDGWDTNTGTYTLAWTLTPPPACNIPKNVTGTMVTLTTANISWTAPVTGTPVSYEYAVTQSETPPATGTVTTTMSFTDVTTVANAYNYVHVRTNCGTDGNSEWVTYRFYSGHCIPNSLYTEEYYNIVAFTTTTGFSNISNTVEQLVAYTNNFDTMVVSQDPGGSFGYTVTIDSYTAVDIWIDWNNDLDFDDEGEFIRTHENQDFVNTDFTNTISIPGVIAQGNYRMRLRSRSTWNSGSPCGQYEYGTAQDYAINIGDPPTCYVPITVTGAGVSSGVANLSWASQGLGSDPVGYEYVVTTSTTSPESGTAITGTSVPGYTGIIDNTWYYLHVRTNCGDGDYSQWAISPRFRHLAGDTCASAIDLATQTSPYSYSTVGAGNDFTSSCNTLGIAPDLYYSMVVPNGYTFTIGLSTGYNAVHTVFYGSCDDSDLIVCTDNDSETTTWENTTGSSQTVYWVQDGDGYGTYAGTFTLTWTLTPPPTCDRPRALDVNLTSLTTTDASWNVPNTGIPVGYEYAVTTSATPPESGTYTTAISASGITVTPNVNSFLHVRTVCSEADGNSIWVSIPFFSGYCVPSNTTSTAYYITGVTSTGGETNFASTSAGFSAFTDNTATHTVSTYPGGSFSLQATTPTAADNFIYSVWIDWNNNFDFTDEGERVINTGYLITPATLGTITVPTTVAPGTYRMRIRNAHFGAPVPACGEQGSGEAEDYTLEVVPAPSCFPPYNPSITPTDPGYANLNWSVPSLGGVPSGYEYVLSTSSTPPTGNGTPSASFFVGDVEYNPLQSVYLFVRSNCGGGDYSTWVSTQILGTDSPDFLANSIVVYKEGSAINITSGNTLMKGVTIYDTRGRKLYSQADINNTEVALTGLQIQQQVVIVEIDTPKGKVSKRIVF